MIFQMLKICFIRLIIWLICFFIFILNHWPKSLLLFSKKSKHEKYCAITPKENRCRLTWPGTISGPLHGPLLWTVRFTLIKIDSNWCGAFKMLPPSLSLTSLSQTLCFLQLQRFLCHFHFALSTLSFPCCYLLQLHGTIDSIWRVLDSLNPYTVATDTNGCPTWEGILYDDLTENVTAIVLNCLFLNTTLKFHTLTNLKMLAALAYLATNSPAASHPHSSHSPHSSSSISPTTGSTSPSTVQIIRSTTSRTSSTLTPPSGLKNFKGYRFAL